MAVCLIGDFDWAWDILKWGETIRKQWQHTEIAAPSMNFYKKINKNKNRNKIKEKRDQPCNKNWWAGLKFPNINLSLSIPWLDIKQIR